MDSGSRWGASNWPLFIQGKGKGKERDRRHSTDFMSEYAARVHGYRGEGKGGRMLMLTSNAQNEVPERQAIVEGDFPRQALTRLFPFFVHFMDIAYGWLGGLSPALSGYLNVYMLFSRT
jgi:hypothetical protein